MSSEMSTTHEKKRKRILVSGCYDLLHSGHVAFFEAAARYGDVFVQLGNDENITKLKGRPPMFPESERAYMVRSIKYVTEANISKGFGMLDWEADIPRIKPDALYVNEDGDRKSKADICKKYGIEYIVDKRKPKEGMNPRSSTALKKMLKSGSTSAASAGASRRAVRCLCASGISKHVWDAEALACVAHAASIVFDISRKSSSRENLHPFESFPILETSDGSMSISYFIAQIEFLSEYGPEDLTGQSASERALLRQIAECVRIARDRMFEMIYAKGCDRESVAVRRQSPVYREMADVARKLESVLKPRPGPLIVGMRPTYADYVISVWIRNCEHAFGRDVPMLAANPRLRKLCDTITSLPRMVPFFSSGKAGSSV